MERRSFIINAGCGLGGLPVLGSALTAAGGEQPRPGGRYRIDIEIFEAPAASRCHKRGDKFEYPKDAGRICPWLLASMHDFIRILEFGGTLPWKYEGTPYEKVIDPNGVTTEFVRCPDPTANLVAKIIRTRLP